MAAVFLGTLVFSNSDPKIFIPLVKPGLVRLQASSLTASRNKWIRAGYAQILTRAPTGLYVPYERSRLVKFPGQVLDLSGYPITLKLEFKPVPWLTDLRVQVWQDSVQSPIVVYTP